MILEDLHEFEGILRDTREFKGILIVGIERDFEGFLKFFKRFQMISRDLKGFLRILRDFKIF